MSLLPIVEPAGADKAQAEFLGRVPPLNLFKTLATAPRLADLTARFGQAILFQTGLDAQLRELAILRTAHLAGSPYEIGHHERIGRDVGMREPLIVAARTGERTGLSELETLAMDWAEDVVAGHAVTPENARRGIERLGEAQAIELAITIGYYLMVAIYLSTFQVPFEGRNFQNGVQINR